VHFKTNSNNKTTKTLSAASDQILTPNPHSPLKKSPTLSIFIDTVYNLISSVQRRSGCTRCLFDKQKQRASKSAQIDFKIKRGLDFNRGLLSIFQDTNAISDVIGTDTSSAVKCSCC